MVKYEKERKGREESEGALTEPGGSYQAVMNYVYILRCADNTLYCGWTTDLEKRLAAHNSGRGAKYTRSRRPVELVYSEAYESRHEALSREWHIKRISRKEKEALCRPK